MSYCCLRNHFMTTSYNFEFFNTGSDYDQTLKTLEDHTGHQSAPLLLEASWWVSMALATQLFLNQRLL